MNTTNTLRIATRQSPLAMWQARHVSDLIQALGIQTEIVPLVSSGDTDMRPIDGTRQVGLFTKRIQQALLENEAEVAVHSLKDLPTEVDDRLALAAIPPREVVNDSLVSPQGYTIDSLPAGARVGTGSRRRAAQLLFRRPDLNVESIRGNVQTRLSKIAPGEFDAIVLAESGLVRLEMTSLTRTALPLTEMCPAPGQGALAIEVRSDDAFAREVLLPIDDLETRLAVTAERTLLANLNGGCLAPIAALGTVKDGQLSLSVRVLSVDGTKQLTADESISLPIVTARDSETPKDDRLLDRDGAIAAAIQLADRVSQSLADQGARELIADVRH